MVRKILLVSLWLLSAGLAKAQLKIIAESPGFPRPQNCNIRLLMLPDGSTAFLTLSKEDGIRIRMYDADHKVKFIRAFKPLLNGEQSREVSVAGIWAAGGDVVVMLTVDGLADRIVIDGQTGMKKSESNLRKPRLLAGKAAPKPGKNSEADYTAFSKDERSGSYALLRYNAAAIAQDSLLTLTRYNEAGVAIDSTLLPSPAGGKYKYLDIEDFAVQGDDYTDVLLKAYNTNRDNTEESAFFLYHADGKAAGAMRITELDLPKSQTAYTDRLMRYNPSTSQYVLLSIVYEHGKRKEAKNALDATAPTFTFIDAAQGTVLTTKPLLEDSASQNAGLPRNFWIRKNGAVTVLFEKSSAALSESASPNFTALPGYETGPGSSTTLSDPALISFDQNGQQTGSYSLRHAYLVEGINLPLFYQSSLAASGIRAVRDNELRIIAPVLTDAGDYLLLNAASDGKDKRKASPVSDVSDCQTYVVELKGSNPAPEQSVLLPMKKNEKQASLLTTGIIAADAATGAMVTLKLYKDSGDEKLRLEWLQAE